MESPPSDDRESDDRESILKDFVDWLLPILNPYEATVYLLLWRLAITDEGMRPVRLGKRTLANRLGQGTRAQKANFQQISKVLKSLELKECIAVGAVSREGTLYTIRMPHEVPSVRERIAAASSIPSEARNYYSDPQLRQELFDRDEWSCRYCGEVLDSSTATLDHIIPVSKNGQDVPENLATSCLLCNSIKSGKTYDEAAPALLTAIRGRRQRGAQEPNSM